MYRSKISYRYV